jgi:hypothetical protein
LPPVSSRGYFSSSLESVFQFVVTLACSRYNVREFCNKKTLPPLNDAILLEAIAYFSTSRNCSEHNNIFPFFSFEGPYIVLIPILGNTDSSERSSSAKETHSLTRTHIHTHISLRLTFSLYFLFCFFLYSFNWEMESLVTPWVWSFPLYSHFHSFPSPLTLFAILVSPIGFILPPEC